MLLLASKFANCASEAANGLVGLFRCHNPGGVSAGKISTLMETVINRLAEYPLLGQLRPDPILSAHGHRKLLVNKTYVAFYRIVGDTVYIYRMVNGDADCPKLLK